MSRPVLLFLLLLAFFAPVPFRAEAVSLSTANVPVGDSAYRDLDKIYSFGLVRRIIKGQRPYSREQFARFADAARRLLDEGRGDPAAERYLLRLEKRFAEEISHVRGEPSFGTWRTHWLESASAEAAAMSDDPRAAPNQNQGFTAAAISPLTDFRGGRHYAPDGFTLGLSSEHFWGATRHFSLHAVPLFEAELDSRYAHARLSPRTFNAKTVFANIAFEAGRDQIVRGFGEHGGVFHTDNARGFDRIALSNEVPVVLPWIFKYAGPAQLDMFAAHLGPENALDGTLLTGWALHFAPLPYLEGGLMYSTIFGDVSFLRGLKEFFGLLPSEGLTPGDAVMEAELRAGLPFLRYAEFYFHFAFDDQNFEPELFFLHDTAYYGGIFIPRLDRAGRADLRLEFRRVPERVFVHQRYVSGKTLNGRAFGDPLGPDADALSLRATFDASERVLLGFEAHAERYDSDTYAATATGNNITGVVRLTDGPEESRLRFAADAEYRWRRFVFGARGGLEFVSAFNFVPGDDRTHFLMALSATYR